MRVSGRSESALRSQLNDWLDICCKQEPFNRSSKLVLNDQNRRWQLNYWFFECESYPYPNIIASFLLFIFYLSFFIFPYLSYYIFHLSLYVLLSLSCHIVTITLALLSISIYQASQLHTYWLAIYCICICLHAYSSVTSSVPVSLFDYLLLFLISYHYFTLSVRPFNIYLYPNTL